MNIALQLHFTYLLEFKNIIHYDHVKTGRNTGSVGKIYPI